MNKPRKRHWLYSIFFITLLSVSSCAPTIRKTAENTDVKEDVLEEWKDKKPKDMPDRIAIDLAEGVEVDAFLEVSTKLSDWKTEELTLTRHLLNETKCLDDLLELLGNPKVTERSTFVKEDTLEDGTPLSVDRAGLEGDAMAQARNAYFLSNFPQKKGITDPPNDFIIRHDGYYDKVEKNQKLAFGDYTDICQDIELFLKKQNIENLLGPVVYSFTPELLQKSADDSYQQYMSLGWTEEAKKYEVTLGKEDGIYIIRYTQGHRGIPYAYLSLVDQTIDGSSLNNETYMCVRYGSQGIISTEGGPFFNLKQTGEEKRILSLYDILDKLRTHFKNNISNKVSIKQIGLCYLPIVKDGSKLEFAAVPVWYAVYAITGDDGTSRETITYNAMTGEVYG